MKRVVLESPYAGEIERNIWYAKLAMKDCLERYEAPFASHLLYTQEDILNDNKPEERELGMECGLYWGICADLAVIYTDYGISKGMQSAINYYEEIGMPIEFRNLGHEVE